MCIQVMPGEIRTLAHWNLTGRSTTAWVIAQQYSPAMYVSLPFHSRKKKDMARTTKMLLLSPTV
jgi:hypothetical protein